MDTLDLNVICSSDPRLARTFQGVFSYDTLPRHVTSYPASYIVNTDKEQDRGEHWVALFLENEAVAEVYDSYGRKPYGRIKTFAGNNARVVKHNNHWFQGPLATTCGMYCVYFLWHRANGVPMDRATGPPLAPYKWTDNDEFVADWLRLAIA